MDSKQIELLAAKKVKDTIISTDRLRPYINENDKTPIWDSIVLLYKADNHENSNKHLKGSVDVQLKES